MENEIKIGLIADTHMPGSIRQLWPEVMEAFEDVDCVLHAGDLHTLDVVDELSTVAPTYVARGNGDVGIVDPRLQDQWMFEFHGVQVGMIHHFPSPERKPIETIHRYLDKHFDEKPKVLIFGHTHFEGIYDVDGVICINPGSPTLPRNQSTQRGTLGYLQISEEAIALSLHQITETGLIAHQTILPFSQNR